MPPAADRRGRAEGAAENELAFVDVAAMAKRDDDHEQHVILDCVGDGVVTDAHGKARALSMREPRLPGVVARR